MANDVWHHALRVLAEADQHHRPEELLQRLYDYPDESGLLKRHQDRMQGRFKRQEVDLKTIYAELIKMLLQENRQQESQDIFKIQGVQKLTTEMQMSMNQRLMQDNEELRSEEEEGLFDQI